MCMHNLQLAHGDDHESDRRMHSHTDLQNRTFVAYVLMRL